MHSVLSLKPGMTALKLSDQNHGDRCSQFISSAISGYLQQENAFSERHLAICIVNSVCIWHVNFCFSNKPRICKCIFHLNNTLSIKYYYSSPSPSHVQLCIGGGRMCKFAHPLSSCAFWLLRMHALLETLALRYSVVREPFLHLRVLLRYLLKIASAT